MAALMYSAVGCSLYYILGYIPFLEQKMSFEKYRKPYCCPIPGCCSTKPIKKLSNHLAAVHRLSTKECLQYLSEAKRSQPDSLPKGQSTLDMTNRYVMEPQTEAKEGSTRSFTNYSSETPELVKFRENLTSFDGGHKSVPDARQISSDIGKYFAHVDKSKIKWISLFDQVSLKSYVDKLVDSKIGPDGIMSKLERLIIAINYTLRELKLSSSEMQMAKLAKERIEAWKGSFKVKKSSHAMEKAAHDAAEERDVSEDIQSLHHVLSSKRAEKRLTAALGMDNLSAEEQDFIATRLFLALTYNNLQRAGAATNLTVAEAKQGKIVVQDGERYLRLFVSKHKTAKTYGPATLYLKGFDLRLMEKFMGIRATASPEEPLLMRSSGTPYRSHYQRYLQQYCKYCGIDKVPTITQYRKAGSTVAKQALPQGTMAQVSRHMGHSSSQSRADRPRSWKMTERRPRRQTPRPRRPAHFRCPRQRRPFFRQAFASPNLWTIPQEDRG